MHKSRPYSDLGRRLLARDLPMGEVRRLLGELRAHRADVIDEAHSAGHTESQAAIIAERRLGTPRQIARAALKRYRRRTFIGRHPVAFFLIAPAFAWFIAWILVLLPVSVMVPWFVSRPRPVSDGFVIMTPVLSILLTLAVPSTLAWLFYRLARRRALALPWRWSAPALLILSAPFLQLDIEILGMGPHGRIMLYGMAFPRIALGLFPLAFTMFAAGAGRRRPQYEWDRTSVSRAS